MTTESLHEITGLSFHHYDPLWFTNRGEHVPLTFQVEDWAHEIVVDGGYRQGRLRMRVGRTEIEDWIESGLGRHFEVIDRSGVIVWEGFVNSVRASLGTLAMTRGPLMHVANRVHVAYRPYIDICVDPPQQGNPTVTTISENADSQTWYGIQEDVVSGGVMVDTSTFVDCGSTGATPEDEAEMLRDMYLEEMRYPQTSEEVTVGATNQPSVEIECLGYYEWLDRYVYENTFANYITVPDKIEAVLAADPNGIISTDYGSISHDAILLQLTPDGDEQERTAMSVIEEQVSRGDGNARRTYFAIYNNRKAHYNTIPTVVSYTHRISSRDQTIQTLGGSIVSPWEVRAGEWVFFSDFLAGRELNVDQRYDPRYMFIESVRYTAPAGLRLVGGKVSTVKQLMARKGLGM